MKILAVGLELVALCLQLAGVLLMANGYTRVIAPRNLPLLLGSAFVRGDVARGAAKVGNLVAEDRLKALQGLALIGLGFLFQAGSSVIGLLL